MKRTKIKIGLPVLLCSVMLLSGCKETMSLDMNFGDSYPIESEKLSKYENLSWTSNNDSIAVVNGKNEIVGTGPGTAVLVAKNDNTTVAEYTVNVNIIPVTGIVLSTNETKITIDDTFQLNYTLFPDNASDYGISWKSADENVAVVDEKGAVFAKNIGQTTISVSNQDGFMATCAVTVVQKAAYERLTQQEKAFVDCALKDIDSFKNPNSVSIIGIESNGTGSWIVKVNAMNGFGGMNSTVYYLDSALGFWNYQLLDIDKDISISPSSEYDVNLINEAINEKRKKTSEE